MHHAADKQERPGANKKESETLGGDSPTESIKEPVSEADGTGIDAFCSGLMRRARQRTQRNYSSRTKGGWKPVADRLTTSLGHEPVSCRFE